jgi:hypothetical protein
MTNVKVRKKSLSVIPAQAGIQKGFKKNGFLLSQE